MRPALASRGGEGKAADVEPRPAPTCQTYVFLLLDGLSLMSLASVLEPLRSCNRLLGHEAYRWVLASMDGAPVAASNGIPLGTVPLSSALDGPAPGGPAALFVCGGLRVRPPDERRHLAVLRNAARRGIPLGAISTGTWLLARAGLLSGYRCTIHWEYRPAFVEAFPALNCTDRLFEIDRNRLTCSGGTAAMDLALRLIADRHGPDLARRVANQFHHQRIRSTEDGQRPGRLDNAAGLPPALAEALRLMSHRIEEPLPISALAKQCRLSARQLERLVFPLCPDAARPLLPCAAGGPGAGAADLLRPALAGRGRGQRVHVHIALLHLVPPLPRDAALRVAGAGPPGVGVSDVCWRTSQTLPQMSQAMHPAA